MSCLGILFLLADWFFHEYAPRVVVHDGHDKQKNDEKEGNGDSLMDYFDIFGRDVRFCHGLEFIELVIFKSLNLTVFF